MSEPVIVAVDGGGSKTDAVALTVGGELVVARRGPGSSPDFEGLGPSVAIVDELVTAVVGDAPVAHVGLYLSGLDLPIETERYRTAIAGRPWVVGSTVVENDLHALLRLGTDEPDAVAVVCGTGINAIGVRGDGRPVRFPALGPISGDWGGGSGLGEQALWHAARDVDGRGPRTVLTDVIASHLDAPSVSRVIEQLHLGERSHAQLSTLVPAIFAAAESGDAVAIALVDRQAEEIAAFARACLTRLALTEQPVPVVLGGGVVRSRDARLLAGIRERIAAVAPLARLEIVDGAPIIGAALLALDAVGAGAAALERAREVVDRATAAVDVGR